VKDSLNAKTAIGIRGNPEECPEIPSRKQIQQEAPVMVQE
jgi:hypothetical protein